MNAAVASYPSLGNKDFEGSITDAQRFRALEIVPSGVSISISALAPLGFTESVNQIVVDRSADLSPSLRRRIRELSGLAANWDGEGAKVIKSYVLADTVEALKRFAQQTRNFREPFLAPTFDGFVQMEWHDKKRSLEIEAVDQGWSLIGTMIGNDCKRHYFTTECERSDFEKLEKFYAWYVGTELLWPSL